MYLFTQDVFEVQEIQIYGDLEESHDPFFMVMAFIQAINNHMHWIVVPGPGIILDDSMMPLNGMTLSERIDGMPAKLPIKWKPEGIGF